MRSEGGKQTQSNNQEIDLLQPQNDKEDNQIHIKNGFVVYEFPNGDKYKGEWKNNLMHGKGTYQWPNGDSYEGEFTNGRNYGLGKYQKPRGYSLTGVWHNYVDNGDIQYCGNPEYKDQSKNEGFSGTFYPNGDQYSFQWKVDKKQGYRAYTYSDDREHFENWEKEQREKRKKEGQWINDYQESESLFISQDDKEYKELCKGGQRKQENLLFSFAKVQERILISPQKEEISILIQSSDSDDRKFEEPCKGGQTKQESILISPKTEEKNNLIQSDKQYESILVESNDNKCEESWKGEQKEEEKLLVQPQKQQKSIFIQPKQLDERMKVLEMELKKLNKWVRLLEVCTFYSMACILYLLICKIL